MLQERKPCLPFEQSSSAENHPLFSALYRGGEALLAPCMTPGFRARHDPIGLDADGKGLTLKPYITVKGGHMKLSVRILIGVVTSVFLFAAIAAPASAASIKIGFVFSMTGGAAVYGTSQKEGASLAIDQINAAAGSSGLQIAPIWEDDASVPQQGTNVFNKLINGDKVSLIIGPTLSNTAKITDPIAQKAGVPVLAISNTIAGITEIGDYIFRNSLTENVVIPHTVKVAKEKLGLKKVAMLYGNDDAMTKATYDVFKKELAGRGHPDTERTGLRQGRPRLFTAVDPDQVSKP